MMSGSIISNGMLTMVSQGLLPNTAWSWEVAGVADFNGDGKSDILWRNTAGENQVWNIDGAQINAGVVTIASQAPLPNVDTTWWVAGLGDYNGDGKADVLWRKSDGTNYLWNVDGAQIVGGMFVILTQGLLPSVDTTWIFVDPGYPVGP